MRHANLLLLLPLLHPAMIRAQSCPADRTPVMVLGMYHMSNPGQDARNVEADDPRSPRRQREIAELLDRLARFRPTLVAVEAPYRDARLAEAWTEWRAGRRELTTNEVQQVGFRLAARLGLDGVRGVDYPMWMNGWTPAEIEQRPPAPRAETAAAAPPSPVDPETEVLRRSTLVEYLRRLNDPERVRADHATYLKFLEPGDEVGIYERSDLLANWYKRNIRILTNLNRVTRIGQDRVVLLIGSGHRYIMDDLVRSAPYLCWVDPLTVLGDR